VRAFTTLLKREWLEARVAFLWIPVGVLAFFAAASVLGALVSGFGEIHLSYSSSENQSPWFFVDTWTDLQVEERMTAFRTLVTAPFYGLYLIAAVFVLLGSLYDDRKDRSVLFWKSLPVSDTATVASKLIVPVVIAPLVMLACALAAQLFVLGLGTAFILLNDLGDPWRLWLGAGLIGGTLTNVLGFLLQVIWSLPVTAFLLVVSAAAPRLTLLWALLVPVCLGIAEYIVFQTSYLSSHLSKHMEPAALPNFLADEERIMIEPTSVTEQLALLVNPEFWLGGAVGVALLFAAVKLRGINNDL
jgi:ABC-2 type transport system permease protein